MNLGAMNEELGHHARALDYYQQSHRLFEGFGDEPRAAQIQANISAILIEYGGKPDEGLRDIENALGVFRKLGDRNWEMFAARVTAASHRHAGRYTEAERELNRAIALAKERNMDGEIAELTVDLARSRFEMSDYAGARTLILQAIGTGSGKDVGQARIYLGRIDTRLGQLDTAQVELGQVSIDVEKRGDTGLLPLLRVAMGELAYELGRLDEARSRFAESAALWTDDLPDAASVEARAALGLLDALEGKPALGRAAVQASLEQARKAGPLSLEAQCRVYLARIEVGDGRFEDALKTLGALPSDSGKRLGLDLQAQLHYWRSRAMAARGDRPGAQSEESLARNLLQDLRASLPEQYRDGFTSRPDIRLLMK